MENFLGNNHWRLVLTCDVAFAAYSWLVSLSGQADWLNFIVEHDWFGQFQECNIIVQASVSFVNNDFTDLDCLFVT